MNDKMSTVEVLIKSYGSHAFGLVGVLVIWFAIMRPELQRRTIDIESVQRLIVQLTERDATQERIANSMAKTADAMETTATLLDGIVDKVVKDRDER